MHKSIQECKLHDHTSLIFNNQTEFFHCAIPFLLNGIKNNEKCLLVIDEITREDTISNFKYLHREGIRPFEELTKGKIVIEEFKKIYLPDGLFNMDRTLNTYISILNKAISEGYEGLRVFAEISYSMKNIIKPENFAIWEIEADKHFDKSNLLAVCAYNKNIFLDQYIKQIIKIHPIEVDLFKTRL